MERTIRLPVLAFITGIAFGVIISGQIAGAQQATAYQANRPSQNDLDEIKGSEMNVWLGELAPGAATGKHTHPTPRFVYVLEGAVVLEMDGKPPQTFKAGQAFAEAPNSVHILRNASATEPAKALGFQYAGKGQPLQAVAP